MAIIEQYPTTDLERALVQNPYAIDVLSQDMVSLVTELSCTEAYIDADQTADTDMVATRVYMVEGTSKFADIARAVEGASYLDKWGQPKEITQSEAVGYDTESTFFIHIDESGEKPKVLGALRILDCSRTFSETERYYAIKNPQFDSDGIEKELKDYAFPSQLDLGDERSGVWDVVGLSALGNIESEYSKMTSAWLNHVLYKRSLELGITRWISNITPKELKHLQTVGVEFSRVKNTGNVFEISKKGKQLKFGFYWLDVAEVGKTVEAKAKEKMILASYASQLIASRALICKFGSDDPENLGTEVSSAA
jgi:hypothetical protein